MNQERAVPQATQENPCQGRCEFHGRLYCHEQADPTTASCEDYADDAR